MPTPIILTDVNVGDTSQEQNNSFINFKKITITEASRNEVWALIAELEKFTKVEVIFNAKCWN